MNVSARLARGIAAGGIAAMVSAPQAPAQNLLFELQGQTPGSRFGHAIDAAGDVDGDGIGDIIVGAPYDNSVGTECGAVYVFSGSNGALIHGLFGDTPGDHFGWSVSGLGDVDGDGLADFLVGAPDDDYFAPQCGSAFVFSGADGSMIHHVFGTWSNFRTGFCVEGAGDLNLDSLSEWYVTSPGDTTFGGGAVRGYDGSSGANIVTLYGGQTASPGFSDRLLLLPDMSGDGYPEAFHLEGDLFDPGPSTTLLVSLADGGGDLAVDWFGTGGPITTTLATEGLGASGARVAYGAPDNFWNPNEADLVQVRDGGTGQFLLGLNPPAGPSNDRFGSALSISGDRDGDLVSDVLVAAPFADPGDLADAGQVYLFSGASGVLLTVIDGQAPEERFGEVLTFLRDLEGDGRDEIAIASLRASPLGFEEGVVRVYGGCDSPGPSNFCTTSPNSAGAGAVMDATGPLSVSDNAFFLEASGLPPSVPGIFFYGMDQVSVPLGDGLRCVGGVFGIQRLEGVISSPSGEVVQQLDFTQPPASSGSGMISPGDTWNFQYWYRDVAAGGTGSNLSDGLRVTFCQ